MRLTAKEMLYKIKIELKNQTNPYTGPDEKNAFEKRHNVRPQKRCCLFCRYGVPDFEGECSCVHPERIIRDSEGMLDDVWLNTRATDVCDSFGERTEENEVIDYGRN